MKQKFQILNGEQADQVVIRESAELDKGLFSVVYEEAFKRDSIQKAADESNAALISMLRTPNFYPTADCVDRIAAGVSAFLTSPTEDGIEVVFDDIESLLREEKPAPKSDGDSSENVELDELLDDDEISDDSLLEGDDLNDISNGSSLRVADDDSIDDEDI